MVFKLAFLNRTILSIDIGTYETKVVEGKITHKGIVINNFFSFLTPEGAYRDGHILEKELLYYVLKEELRKNKLSSKITYLTIKSSSIITEEIKIPVVKDKDIEGILKYELKEYLPIGIEDYIIQYKILNKVKVEEIEKLRILLIAIPKEIVENHFILLRDLGLKPTVLDFQLNSVSKLLKYNQIINENQDIKDTVIALIDLGFINTSVIINRNDDILFNQSIEFGGDSMNENRMNGIDKGDIEIMLKEINSVFVNYKKIYKEDEIRKIFLYGGLSNIKDMGNIFEKYFNMPSIRIKNMDNIYLKEDLNKYVNCVGCIIRAGE